MSNWDGARRLHKRNYEVCRLIINKQLRDADPNLIHWRDWHAGDYLQYRQYYRRTRSGIELFDWEPNTGDKRNIYKIAFNKVHLTYGIRYQFTCPRCSCAARILYLQKNTFACRKCHRINYESTHGGDLANLLNIVSKQRLQTFGKSIIEKYELPLWEFSDWLPQPKHSHKKNFKEKLKGLAVYEHRLQNEMLKRGNRFLITPSECAVSKSGKIIAR
jgi:hypothetical protein